MTNVADCRAAFAAAATMFSGPLYRHWCTAASAEIAADDRTFTAFAAYGLDFGSWHGPQRPLAGYFPVLSGTLAPDGRSYQLWTELLRDRRGPIGRRLQERPLPLNDPQAGVRILRLVTEHLQAVYAEPVIIDLVAVGAAAGLELVADEFEPDLLAGQHIASRRGFDIRPLHPQESDTLDRMLSQLEPEQVAAQKRVQRAVRLVDEQDIVVSRRDAFDAVAAEGFGFGRLPVVFGSSFLCTVQDRRRMDDLMRARHAEGIWVSEEAVGVLRSVSDAASLRGAESSNRAVRLAHYRAGELLAEVIQLE
jgi:hypothetical protein